MASNDNSQASGKASLREQIEATLKFLPVGKDEVDEAYLENNKLILVEDFGVDGDAELSGLIMGYRPQAPRKA